MQQAEIAVDRVYTGYFPADGIDVGMGRSNPWKLLALSEPARAPGHSLVDGGLLLWAAGAAAARCWTLVGWCVCIGGLGQEDETVGPPCARSGSAAARRLVAAERSALRVTRLIDSPGASGSPGGRLSLFPHLFEESFPRTTGVVFLARTRPLCGAIIGCRRSCSRRVVSIGSIPWSGWDFDFCASDREPRQTSGRCAASRMKRL